MPALESGKQKPCRRSWETMTRYLYSAISVFEKNRNRFSWHRERGILQTQKMLLLRRLTNPSNLSLTLQGDATVLLLRRTAVCKFPLPQPLRGHKNAAKPGQKCKRTHNVIHQAAVLHQKLDQNEGQAGQGLSSSTQVDSQFRCWSGM